MALDGDASSTISILGPVPPPPTRNDTRKKVGLTLPTRLAEAVRRFTSQGYALADLVMVAYQDHRDELVSEHQAGMARKLERRAVGRSSITMTLSAAERDALDALGRHLDTTRSHTVAVLLERHLANQGASAVSVTPAQPASRSLA